jgi:hypothetical protein
MRRAALWLLALAALLALFDVTTRHEPGEDSRTTAAPQRELLTRCERAIVTHRVLAGIAADYPEASDSLARLIRDAVCDAEGCGGAPRGRVLHATGRAGTQGAPCSSAAPARS